MKVIFYDWLGFNAWLFNALYRVNTQYLDDIWRLLSYGYSYWVPVFIALAISVRYLNIRHTASEPQFVIMSELMAVLILSFSLISCVVFTLQTVTFWPRPGSLYPDLVSAQSPLLWHEGFPASAPAIAMMVCCIFWRHAGGIPRAALAAYLAAACLLSIVSGINWPADVVFGLIAGALAVRFARLYYRFGARLVAS